MTGNGYLSKPILFSQISHSLLSKEGTRSGVLGSIIFATLLFCFGEMDSSALNTA